VARKKNSVSPLRWLKRFQLHQLRGCSGHPRCQRQQQHQQQQQQPQPCEPERQQREQRQRKCEQQRRQHCYCHAGQVRKLRYDDTLDKLNKHLHVSIEFTKSMVNHVKILCLIIAEALRA
jgi:hypothetical protein